jgi:hypothetical protein
VAWLRPQKVWPRFSQTFLANVDEPAGTTGRTAALNLRRFAAGVTVGTCRWEWLGLKCRNCGDVVDPRRVELGYDYCLREECQQRCLQRVELAAVGVNKAADYYMRADEVLPPPPPPTRETEPPASATSASAPPASTAPIDVDQPARHQVRKPRGAGEPRRVKTTLQRLGEQEAELDEALDRVYQRFCGGEITAREMDGQRHRLIEAFNRQVMSENIRYRSFLRRGVPQGRRVGRP